MAGTSDNRLKRFLVSPELIMMLGSGKYEVVENPLPEDIELQSAYYSERERAFCVVMHSEEFEPVTGGDIPLVDRPTIRRLEE